MKEGGVMMGKVRVGGMVEGVVEGGKGLEVIEGVRGEEKEESEEGVGEGEEEGEGEVWVKVGERIDGEGGMCGDGCEGGVWEGGVEGVKDGVKGGVEEGNEGWEGKMGWLGCCMLKEGWKGKRVRGEGGVVEGKGGERKGEEMVELGGGCNEGGVLGGIEGGVVGGVLVR